MTIDGLLAKHGLTREAKQFKASNGTTILVLEKGLGFQRAGSDLPSEFGIDKTKVDALREYFQHEYDEGRGRWRSPQYTQFVVYPNPSQDACMVINEASGMSMFVGRESPILSAGPSFSDNGIYGYIAKSYFDTLAPPRPWLNAKPREVWLVQYDKCAEPEPAVVQLQQGTLYFFHAGERKTLTNTTIIKAERIWSPEEL